MGQKIHPIGFRLGINQSHQSQWFVHKSIYPNLIYEDNFLRNTIFSQFPIGVISKIEIKRKFDDQINLLIYSFKPNAIINHYDNDLKNFNAELIRKIKKFRKTHFLGNRASSENFKKLCSNEPKFIIQIFEISLLDINATFVADFLAEQLQKRVTFRRAIKKTLQRVQKTSNKGIKIQISGRLNGAEIARSEWSRNGQIPLQTLRAPIDYCFKQAKTIYGILGIKVWMLKS